MTDQEFLADLGREIRDQDNLATAHPLFIVQQRRREYGIADDFDPDGYAIGPPEAELEDLEDVDDADPGQLPEDWQAIGYRFRWEFVTAALTRRAAERFIAENRHNLDSPRIWVGSLYRVPEMIRLRDALVGLTEEGS